MSLAKMHHPKIQHRGDNPDRTTVNRKYFWIWAEGTGRRIVWGAYNTRQEAERIAASKLNCPYEVVELNTRDEGQASRILRARMLGDTGDIDGSFQRFSHKMPNNEGEV
jgi:hypothetical protein